ncbi:hypothetical protein E2C01_088728 [Portunus trituberculatus]|uniref:Uncharacterized protein n=1 Tax=Portunus trituberculatus TaxID=210409 RepID=A0A5B7JMP0_PORTR|nr:hypothetical protein [Portunus trituberculatus]
MGEAAAPQKLGCQQVSGASSRTASPN